jgi:hypothetical protein
MTRIVNAIIPSIEGEDDGTFILFKFAGTTYMKVEKSTGDLYIAGDIKTRESL